MEHSKGKIRADVAHNKLVALGFTGSERPTQPKTVLACDFFTVDTVLLRRVSFSSSLRRARDESTLQD